MNCSSKNCLPFSWRFVLCCYRIESGCDFAQAIVKLSTFLDEKKRDAEVCTSSHRLNLFRVERKVARQAGNPSTNRQPLMYRSSIETRNPKAISPTHFFHGSTWAYLEVRITRMKVVKVGRKWNFCSSSDETLSALKSSEGESEENFLVRVNESLSLLLIVVVFSTRMRVDYAKATRFDGILTPCVL